MNFPLLSDYNKKLVKLLGISSLTGTAKRVTFILDENGKVIKIFPKVSPADHAQEVIEFLSNYK